MAGAEFCLSNKRKIHQGLGDEIMETATEWKTHRVVDSPRNEALGRIGSTVMVGAYLLTPAGCVFS